MSAPPDDKKDADARDTALLDEIGRALDESDSRKALNAITNAGYHCSDSENDEEDTPSATTVHMAKVIRSLHALILNEAAYAEARLESEAASKTDNRALIREKDMRMNAINMQVGVAKKIATVPSKKQDLRRVLA